MADDLDKLNRELDEADAAILESSIAEMKPEALTRIAGIVSAETSKRTPPNFASMSDQELHDWKYRNQK